MSMISASGAGWIRKLVFQEGDTFYGVAPDLNIIVDDDDPSQIDFNLDEAINGYLESIIKAGLSLKDILKDIKLDQPMMEYEILWSRLCEGKPISKRYQVFSFGHEAHKVP